MSNGNGFMNNFRIDERIENKKIGHVFMCLMTPSKELMAYFSRATELVYSTV